jgi:hypothetical protein
MSKLKHYGECLESFFLNRKLVANKMYIDKIVWLVVQNNKRKISEYTSLIFPLPPPFNDDNLLRVYTRLILSANT